MVAPLHLGAILQQIHILRVQLRDRLPCRERAQADKGENVERVAQLVAAWQDVSSLRLLQSRNYR